MDLQQQLEGLWLKGHKPLGNEDDAVRYMKSVGFALRYNALEQLEVDQKISRTPKYISIRS